MAMTLQQALAAFSGPRTYTAPDGSVRRTAAWSSFLQRNGLSGGGGSGIGIVPSNTPAPTAPRPTAPISFRPESHADPINPATGGIAGAVAKPVAIAPPPPPPKPRLADFSSYQDSAYFSELAGYRRQYDDANASLAARLARLNSRIDPATGQAVTGGVGGKTLYDLMYERQNQQLARNVSMSRSEAARRGVLRSGYMDRTLTGVASDDLMAKDGLVREYGYEGLRGSNGELDMRSAGNQLLSERNRLQQQFEEAQRLLAQSASQRGLENAMTQYQQMYQPLGGN